MPDYNAFLQAIKQASKDTQEASDPATICTGTVESASPLKVNVEQKFTIGKENLIVPQHLKDYSVDVTIEWETEENEEIPEPHIHEVKGKKRMTIHSALKKGDKVVLIKEHGGQRYLIMDRM